jgi:hypothetical protein
MVLIIILLYLFSIEQYVLLCHKKAQVDQKPDQVHPNRMDLRLTPSVFSSRPTRVCQPNHNGRKKAMSSQNTMLTNAGPIA